MFNPWTCLEGPAQYVSYDHLKHCKIEVINGPLKGVAGHYLFTIDYFGGGLAEDPEQYKSHNVVELQNGTWAALPNNYLKFVDEYFTSSDADTSYLRRSTKYYRTN